MFIEQLYDYGLAHGSYVIISNGEAAVVDTARDPQPYLDKINELGAKLKYIIETHPHADFVSSHLELSKLTGAPILVSTLLGAEYDFTPFDDGTEVKLGNVILKSLHTPGHSPDSISILAIDENGKEHSIFTGDTLFVGDVGRPDLREEVGAIQQSREDLARDMFHSTRNKIMTLQHNVIVYPAHGAGSLCGKNLSSDLTSTIGKELESNYALQNHDVDSFVKILTDDQPFVPKYFGYDVNMNKKGAPNYMESVNAVKRADTFLSNEKGLLVIDSRPQDQYKAGFFEGSINIPNDLKFETWVGSLVAPTERFYLVATNEEEREELIRKLAKIGYELLIETAYSTLGNNNKSIELIDLDAFKSNKEAYNVVDVRNVGEYKDGAFINGAKNFPLPNLREEWQNIDISKPVIVHCKGGYRSAIATSILHQNLKGAKIYDLSFAIEEFKS